MIKIKDTYISTTNIKQIRFEESFGYCYLVIKYSFDPEEIKLEVSDIDEFDHLAFSISSAINGGLNV